MDIRFYNYDFNLLYILPFHKSFLAQIDLNGNGSFELHFTDEELKEIIKSNVDNMLISTKNFQGYTTGYLFDKSGFVLYGKHLNGLLHKEVFNVLDFYAFENTVEEIAYSTLSNKNISWLSLGEKIGGYTNKLSFVKDKPCNADEYLSELFAQDNAGYSIKADFANKRLTFNTIRSTNNPLILSEGNLNAFDVSESYDNKTKAFGGWYLQEQPPDESGNKPESIWTYTSLKGQAGLYKQDIVLSATTEEGAITELKEKTATNSITSQTRNLIYGEDYKLGDIIRFQQSGNTIYKIVSGVFISSEGMTSTEEPILQEVR